jgi:hypothetical protein
VAVNQAVRRLIYFALLLVRDDGIPSSFNCNSYQYPDHRQQNSPSAFDIRFTWVLNKQIPTDVAEEFNVLLNLISITNSINFYHETFEFQVLNNSRPFSII